MNHYAPIALFTYNRLQETRQTLKALTNNELAAESDLYVFSDGPKTVSDQAKVKQVREFLNDLSGFKRIKIIESQSNLGLAKSIVTGVTEVLKQHDRVVVLEDDLICNPNFLTYMNQALDVYANDERIQTVTGFSLAMNSVHTDVYFQRRPFSWGWATWKKYWDAAVFDKEIILKEIQSDVDVVDDFKKVCGNNMGNMLLGYLAGKNDSWFVRWAYSQYKAGRYSVIPTKSLVENIGFGVDGTHCKGINPYRSLPEQKALRTYNLTDFKVPEAKETKEFLSSFTIQHKIKVRLGLLKSSAGRSLLLDEIKEKLL